MEKEKSKKRTANQRSESKSGNVVEHSEIATRVRQLADVFEAKLTDTTRVSVADWIKLLALHEKLAVKETREIKVQWVEPETGEPSSEE